MTTQNDRLANSGWVSSTPWTKPADYDHFYAKRLAETSSPYHIVKNGVDCVSEDALNSLHGLIRKALSSELGIPNDDVVTRDLLSEACDGLNAAIIPLRMLRLRLEAVIEEKAADKKVIHIEADQDDPHASSIQSFLMGEVGLDADQITTVAQLGESLPSLTVRSDTGLIIESTGRVNEVILKPKG